MNKGKRFTEEQLLTLNNYHEILEKAIRQKGNMFLQSTQKKILGEIYLTFSPNDCISGCGNQWLWRLANWYFKTLEDKNYVIR